MTVKEVSDYVVRNGLDERTQRIEIAWKRFILCDYLRTKHKLIYQDIADIVGYEKHDRVIYAIKKHEVLKRDRKYKKINADLYSLFKYGEDVTKQDLRTEVLKADSIIELHLIQKKMNDGLI